MLVGSGKAVRAARMQTWGLSRISMFSASRRFCVFLFIFVGVGLTHNTLHGSNM